MSVIRVRPAARADQEAALGLWLALHREHEALEPRYRLAADAAARWAHDFPEWVRSDHHCLRVAESDGSTLVGLLTAHAGWPVPVYAPVSFVHVDDLFVDPSARGQGLGVALLDAVRVWAAGIGATEIRAGVLAANPAGRAFWGAQGAEPFSTTVIVPLEEYSDS
ncbi:MAG: GNAT family N-acetyltransferase [Rhodothermaceae bacterium]|nr:GNAT family N-acetyltransferase [Rhodothermaceae bacterium]